MESNFSTEKSKNTITPLKVSDDVEELEKNNKIYELMMKKVKQSCR